MKERNAFDASIAFFRAQRLWKACTRATFNASADHCVFIAYFNGGVPQ